MALCRGKPYCLHHNSSSIMKNISDIPNTVYFNTSKLLSMYLLKWPCIWMGILSLYMPSWNFEMGLSQSGNYLSMRNSTWSLGLSWLSLDCHHQQWTLIMVWQLDDAIFTHPSHIFYQKDVTDVNYDRVGEKSMCLAYINGRQWFSLGSWQGCAQHEQGSRYCWTEEIQ